MAARRILILTNRIPYPLNDGGNLAMHAMIENYRSAGWEVALLAMNTSRHWVDKATLDSIYTNIHSFETVEIDNEINSAGVLKNLLFSSKPNHAERFYHKAYEQKLLQTIDKFEPDIIQLESVFLTTYLPAVKKASKAFKILRMHNVEHQIWERLAAETGNLVKKAYLKNLAARVKQFEQDAWQTFDLLLPITQVDASVVAATGITVPCHVTPFGIDTAEVATTYFTGKLNTYHIGAMDWLPNAEGIKWFLTSIWPAVHKQHPDAAFYYAGRNMPASFMQWQLDGAHCVGEVPDADAFIADKQVLIVPLQAGGGIRIKVLEAMAAGKLVISTAVGMQGIEATSGTEYIAADTIADFIAALGKIYDNPAIAGRIAINASKLVKEKYDAGIIAANLQTAIEQAMDSHTAD